MNRLKELVEYWFVAPSAAIACCVLCVIMFMMGLETMSAIFGFLAVVSLALQVLFFLLSLIARKWRVAIMTVVGFIGSAIVGIFTMVMFAAGQYRPPHQGMEELVDTTEVVVEEAE